MHTQYMSDNDIFGSTTNKKIQSLPDETLEQLQERLCDLRTQINALTFQIREDKEYFSQTTMKTLFEQVLENLYKDQTLLTRNQNDQWLAS